MFFDPLYMVIMGLGMLLSLGAQAWVFFAVRTQSNVPLRSGMTGAEVAALVARRGGLTDVRIEETDGWLSDHYDPTSRTLRLSSANYHGRSVAAAGIAAHEAGHAIQHAQGYRPMALRQKMVPAANIGTQLGILLVAIGIGIGMLGLAKLGVIVFGAFVVFTVVTLPVEFDASQRAKAALASTGRFSAEELSGVNHVLSAAWATYLAAALSAMLQLAYFALRVSGASRRDD
jgi:Zn-dependent membrane protease YugP